MTRPLRKEGALSSIANGCVLISQHFDSMALPLPARPPAFPTSPTAPPRLPAQQHLHRFLPSTGAPTMSTHHRCYERRGHRRRLTGTLAGRVVLTDVNTIAAEGTRRPSTRRPSWRTRTRHVFDCSALHCEGETLTSKATTWTPIPTGTPTPRPSWTATCLVHLLPGSISSMHRRHQPAGYQLRRLIASRRSHSWIALRHVRLSFSSMAPVFPDFFPSGLCTLNLQACGVL